MKSLVAVSPAANILQFVHTARQLVFTIHEILSSGTKDDYVELELISKDLRSRSASIILPGSPRAVSEGDDENLLEVLAIRRNEIADELLGILEALKLHNDRNNGENFVQALKTQWHDGKIRALRESLNRITKAINARLADEKNVVIHSRLGKLLGINRRLEIARTMGILTVRREFDQALINSQDNTGKEESADLMISEAYSRELEKIVQLAPNNKNMAVTILRWVSIAARPLIFEELAEALVVSDEVLHYSAERKILSRLRFARLEDRYRLISPAHRNTWARLFGDTNLKYQPQVYETSTFVQRLHSDNNLYWVTGRPASGKSKLIGFLRHYQKTNEYLTTWAGKNGTSIAEGFTWNAGKNDLWELQEGLLRLLPRQIIRQYQNYILLALPGVWHAFGRNLTDKLYMQDSNYRAINAYTKDVFENDHDYQELEGRDTFEREHIQEIVAAVNRMFLWVIRVVESLQDGSYEEDSIARLHKRLRMLPTNGSPRFVADLVEFVERVLFRDIEEMYRSESSHMFLVTSRAKENLPLMTYWCIGEHLPNQRLPLKMQQTIERQEEANKRLIANFKGLLGLRSRSTTEQRDSLPSAISSECTVIFLHMTAQEYLLLPKINFSQWAEPHFNPDDAIHKALYWQMKTAPHGKEHSSYISALYQGYIDCAYAVKTMHGNEIAIQPLSAELVDIVSQYGIKVANPLAIEDAHTHDPSTSSDLYNAEEAGVVTLRFPSAKSELQTEPHQKRPSVTKRSVSKLSIEDNNEQDEAQRRIRRDLVRNLERAINSRKQTRFLTDSSPGSLVSSYCEDTGQLEPTPIGTVLNVPNEYTRSEEINRKDGNTRGSKSTAFVEFIWKLMRPRVRPGHKRLEWTCTCGESLYSDFEEKAPGSLDQLAARLKQLSGQSSQHGASVSISQPKKAHTRQANTVGYSMPGGSSSSSNGQNNLANNVAGPSGLKAVKSSPPTALQLCIETGRYKLEMGELARPNSAVSDGELFAMIRARYETTRRSILPTWARFKNPDKANFVKFFLGPRRTVSLDYKTPSIPPATEVRHNYDYDPCPMELPPMDSRLFFHHFYAPKSQHPDVFWSERLPWKVGPALRPKDNGWGIHIDERPNWSLFAALACVLLLLSGAVAGTYGWKMEDAQTGVAIGAWLTSVQIMGVTAVFFWWS